jgi:pimeloyl-ACP methyl ester carboxylesterase
MRAFADGACGAGRKQVAEPRGRSRAHSVSLENFMKSSPWLSSRINLNGVDVHLRRRGSGRPLLVLHHDIGSPDELEFYDILADSFEVILPEHSGYGRSERQSWMRSVRDQAVIYNALIDRLDLDDPILVGLGFGGWIAAEMATMTPSSFERLVLVNPMGVKPSQGDILDQALLSYIDYVRAGFHDQRNFDRIFGDFPTTDQLEQWDLCREMSFRIAWKPYMYSQTLPFLLPMIQTPTLVVWGEQNQVVPRSAAEIYTQMMPGSRLEILSDCGHLAEMEQPEKLAGLIAAQRPQLQGSVGVRADIGG